MEAVSDAYRSGTLLRYKRKEKRKTNDSHVSTYKEMRMIITLQEKRLKIERETYPHEADKLFVTNSFIGFVIGRWAFRSRAVAKGGITTSVVVTTFDTISQLARFRAARTLHM